MMDLHWTIEELLSKTSRGWRWLRFLRHSIVLATVAAGLTLLLGLGVSCGVVATASMATGWIVLLAAGVVLAWFAIALESAVVENDRSMLAASIEHAHAPLLDRLNTLVYLEEQGPRQPHPYTAAIASQAFRVVSHAPPLWPFSQMPIVSRLGILAAVVALTLLYYDFYQPWQHLRAAQGTPPQASQEEPSLEIPPTKEPLAEEPAWGEIRITRPGGDVRATPRDAVPLEIEAASNRPLQKVEWSTAINGGTLQRHDLPPPAGSHFAVNRPTLDLKTLGAKEFDVVGYSARATTADGKTFESDMYFVEVAPLREELKKIPGGREGPSQGLLERLTEMIRRQEEVIRQTHKLGQLADQAATDRKLPREVLAREEGDLSDSARHLAADADGELDEAALATVDERLEQSAESLSAAQKSLPAGKLDESLRKEEKALAALIAARKQFRENLLKQLAEAPAQAGEAAADRPPKDADGQSPQAEDTGTPSPKESIQKPSDTNVPEANAAEASGRESERRESEQKAARLAERLDQMQNRQGQIESLRETVKKVLAGERELEGSPDLRNPATMPRAAQRQSDLTKTLQEATEKNAACMGNCQKESASAQGAMGRAAQAMQAGKPGPAGAAGQAAARMAASQMAGKAADELQKLDEALERQEERTALAAAYQLKRMLDHEIGQLGRAEKQGASPAQAKENAQQSKSITGAMKSLAERAPTSTQFGQPLRDALSGPNKQKLDAQSDRLAQAPSPGQRSQASGQLGKDLQQVSRAFDASCPSGVGRGRGSSPRPEGRDGRERLANGLRQLEGLSQLQGPAQRQAQSGVQSQGTDGQAEREALANLEGGVESVYGYNDRTREVLDRLRKELKKPKIVIDISIIESLLRQIQPLEREVSAGKTAGPQDAKQTYIDPSRLPPAYRKSIESYFQKLSEQR